MLWAAGGCLSDGGSVTLTVSQAMTLSPSFDKFSASNATAVTDSEGIIHFTAASATGQLTMDVQSPISVGAMVDLDEAHNFVSFNVNSADGWSSNGGKLAVDGVNPYRVRFISVPMLVGSGAVTGTFVFDGSGTFK
jgi:hypothetical protein